MSEVVIAAIGRTPIKAAAAEGQDRAAFEADHYNEQTGTG